MSDHCCESMTEQLNQHCGRHDDPFDCPDTLMHFSAGFREYGPIVHDGSTAVIGIAFCPWCGRRLPESRRDRWFEELERRGIDPWEDEVPAEFEDGTWLADPGS
ncbi:DUF6980 family protein [Kitasatospora sp. NPDC008115]|uniref:DUF6980 family protein n=1 Tax=Kitasatospora sp. NPDC008115 TaxID=3364022 RepID=UPI0036E281FA